MRYRMQSIASMTASDVISDAVLDEVFSEEDENAEGRAASLTLEDKATELGVKSKFRATGMLLTSVWKSKMRTAAKSNAAASLDNWTNFEGPYDRMYCGAWIAREDGVWVRNYRNHGCTGLLSSDPADRTAEKPGNRRRADQAGI